MYQVDYCAVEGIPTEEVLYVYTMYYYGEVDSGVGLFIQFTSNMYNMYTHGNTISIHSYIQAMCIIPQDCLSATM